MIQYLTSIGTKYYGIALLEKLSNINYIPIKHIKKADVLHIGIMSNVEFFDLFRWMNNNKIILDKNKRNEKPFIIIGGRGVENATIREIADAVVWGEADSLYGKFNGIKDFNKLKEILASENYIDFNNKKASVYNEENVIPSFSWDFYSKEKTNSRGYIEIGRGCKQRCLFCDLGWTRKNNAFKKMNLINSELKLIKSKDICFLIPDLTDYPDMSLLRENIKLNNKKLNYDSERLKKSDYWQDGTTTLRWGIEGLSYRLRKAINKPITNEEILQAIVNAQDRGAIQIKFFLIPDLPFYIDEDKLECRSLLDEIEKIRKNLVLRLKFTSFEPDTRSPLRYASKKLGLARKISKEFRRGKMYGFVLIEDAYNKNTELKILALQRMNFLKLFGHGERIDINFITAEQDDSNECFDFPLPFKDKYYSIYQKYKLKLI